MIRSQSRRKAVRVALSRSAKRRPRLRAGSDANGARANAAIAMIQARLARFGALLTLAAGALNYQAATGARMAPTMTTDVTMTDRAAQRIGEILKSEPGAMLRLSVLGGGCSGFQYKFDVERDKADDDVTIDRGGVTL